MKKLFLFLPLAACTLFISCGNSNEGDNATITEVQEEMHGTHTSALHPEGTDLSQIDPICDMVKDDTWTDYLIHKEDTVWFCSEHCKDAFAANPEKYRP